MDLFLLSKENISLAKGEIEAIFGKGKLIENVFLVNTKKSSDRLAYTKLICKLLFECNEKNIEESIKEFNWNRNVNETFALFFLEDGKDPSQTASRKYGGMIYDLLKNPKVDLENPKTKIIAIKIKDKVYFGIEKWQNEEKFFERRPNLRPGHQPVTLLPKLARACVNLTGSETSVYDPFCGTGGFLIEAGLMKLTAIGSDVSLNMISLCKKNLSYYNIKKYDVFIKDALTISKKYDYIVTDPPYGKASKVVGTDLYKKFLLKLKKILKKRAVVIFPSFMDAKMLIKNSKLKIKANYSVYVHKSLTRNIYVLEP